MSLRQERPTAAYKCTQEEFYQVCILGWDSYLANQSAFAAFNTLYTTAFGNAQRTEVVDAMELPDFQARDEASETAGILLKEKADECLIAWKALESHIKRSFPESLHKPKLESAGYDNYSDAGHYNWESITALLKSANSFITDNTAALTTGGMPSNFAAAFSTLKNDFNQCLDTFQLAKQEAEEARDTKINADNVCFKVITQMFEDGQKIFRAEAAKRERFTFSKVLGHVSGTGSNLRSVVIAPGESETVHNTRAGSAITNISTVVVFISAGDTALPEANATTLQPGESVPNSFGRVLTFSNNDAGNSAKVALTILES